MKKKFLKIVSVFVALNVLSQIVAPTVALALTGGPSQPEVESFEPVGTTEMVDLFSGDFNYNLPLLTVPGPNGGYPVNLAYHAGIGMEQEASWVGLGWNINPGVINRQVRGLPDDFSGESITKTTAFRPNRTWALNYSKGSDAELFGFDFPAMTYQSYYNNYKGMGTMISLALGNADQNSNGYHFSPSLQLSYSTDGGLGVYPSISCRHVAFQQDNVFNLGFGYNSREGLNNISLSHKREDVLRYKKMENGNVNITGEALGHGSGVSFSGSSFVPNVSSPMKGANIHAGIAMGSKATVAEFKKRKNLKGSYSYQTVDTSPYGTAAYGYLYSHKAGKSSLMDFNREKDVPVTKDAPSVPIPNFTYDIYTVKGQGIGSVYRPFRSDIGMLHDPAMTNITYGGNVTLEAGAGAAKVHFGGDFGTNQSTSYSGVWQMDRHYDEIKNLVFKDTSKALNAPFYQPYYFKAAGEQTAVDYDRLTTYLQGEKPVRFNLGTGFSGISFKPKALDELVDGKGASTVGALDGNGLDVRRQRRMQSIQQRTNNEIKREEHYACRQTMLYDDGVSPAYPYNATGSNSDQYAYDSNDQLGEISAINPDGNRYVYGLPAYNTSHEDVTFSIDNHTGFTGGETAYQAAKSAAYTGGAGGDNSTSNAKGDDKYYSRVVTPKYAHSFLLTAIYSPDYVDLKGDGPSEDDLGYYVKFNYTKTNTAYKWRIPYFDASCIRGVNTNYKDDKLAYSYGTKEIYYLNSIETKTHVAEFILNAIGDGHTPRYDGWGAHTEDNFSASPTYTSSGQELRYLDRIKLFSKNDPTYLTTHDKPVKTVRFEYNYELCKNAHNNKWFSNGGQYSSSGKLTLKKVWFEYLSNTKGSLSPYQFEYNASGPPDANMNPDYGTETMDRWGNYKPEIGTETRANGFVNQDNSYVRQMADHDRDGTIEDGAFAGTTSTEDDDLRNKHASAWCLRKIILPSGGEISVDYESDDYAYVQDKRAMQMMRIVGCGSETGTKLQGKTNVNRRVYFELEKPVTLANAQSLMDEYLEGVEKVYFKTFLRLKYPAAGGSAAYDYVDGYAKIKKSAFEDPTGGPNENYDYGVGGSTTISGTVYYTKGFFTLEPAYVKDLSSGGLAHPFSKAGWQYLRFERPDLFKQPNNLAGNVYNTFLWEFDVFKETFKMFTGYYKFCQIAKYCDQIHHTAGGGPAYFKPSYVRLNTPDKKKFGGGHRVKKITIADKWSSMDTQLTSADDFTYGQEYSYVLPDGTSSGVAEYEPLIGGEEIPQHLPVPYSNDRFLLKDKALYLELPYCESFYPGASVGYSRVVVRSLKREVSGSEVNALTASGFTVNEFYTAKDFPLQPQKSDIDDYRYMGFPIQIPFVGNWSFNNRGYSQGYSIVLNDMHGKPKSVATYASKANISSSNQQPLSKVEYIYSTVNPYDPNAINELKNDVTVLDNDGITRTAPLGVTNDFYIDMRENSNITIDAGAEPNCEATPYILFGTIIPYYNYAESMFRSLVTNKVISKTGILTETKKYEDGSLVATKNLMFDAATGQPLLTQVTNEYNAPIYNYTIPAQWAYDNMGPAAENYKMGFINAVITSGEFSCANADASFNLGDEVEVVYPGTSPTKRYWVTSINAANDKVTLKDEQGGLAATVVANDCKMLVVNRSGKRNQQSIPSATIVSLKHPVSDRKFSVLTAYNTDATGDATLPASITYTDQCTAAEGVQTNLSWNATDNRTLSFTPNGSGYSARVVFPAPVTGSDKPTNYSFKRAGNKVYATSIVAPYNVTVCQWFDEYNLFTECLDNVLQAGATQFSDQWTYNYVDAGDPVRNSTVGGCSSTSAMSGSIPNAYRYGTSGIWRTERSNVYLVNRKGSELATLDANIKQHQLSKDGVFENFRFFNWTQQSNTGTNWAWTSRVCAYSPYGFELENQDALGRYSAALYGYSNSLATAVAANSSYYETAFDGFEDYGNTTSSYVLGKGHGHIDLVTNASAAPALKLTEAHTGSKSVEIPTGASGTIAHSCTVAASSPNFFSPAASTKYVVTAWFKHTGGTPSISITGAGVNSQGAISIDAPIEGWKRVERVFTTNASGAVAVTLSTGGTSTYVDDIRIQPFSSSLKSYVYDPHTLWLTAELDERNYATFYNYDEQGALVQVKKETTKGVVTLKTSRNNTKR